MPKCFGEVMPHRGLVGFAEHHPGELEAAVERGEGAFEIVRDGMREGFELVDEFFFLQPGGDGVKDLFLGEWLGDEIRRA